MPSPAMVANVAHGKGQVNLPREAIVLPEGLLPSGVNTKRAVHFDAVKVCLAHLPELLDSVGWAVAVRGFACPNAVLIIQTV